MELRNRVWNWKTAAFGAWGRAVLFAWAGLHSGRSAAVKAMITELLLTAALSGLQGAILQAMRRLEPPWRASLLSVAVVSLVVHPSEWLAHTLFRNPDTHIGIALSFLFTLGATQLSLCLMRRGLFVTGADGRPLAQDLRALAMMLAGAR